FPPGYCAPSSSSGTPGFRLGRDWSVTPATFEVAPRMSTGGADRARTNASTDQPRSAAATPPRDPGEVTDQVNPALKACRMSKSESPRSISGGATIPGVLRLFAASVEAMSIEWENVYEARP